MTGWDVEVLRGKAVELEEGIPMEFGTPTSYVGDDGQISPTSVNLVYTGVGLRIEPGEAWLYVWRDGSTHNFRFMAHLTSVELDWDGRLRLFGMEERADGALVSALWEANHHYPTREEFEANESLLVTLDPDADDVVEG